MMEKNDNTNSAIKKALGRRDTGLLTPDFTGLMMQKVRREAAKKSKRRAFITGLSFAAALTFIMGLMVYTLFFRMGINPVDYVSGLRIGGPSLGALQFYGYIGFLALLLLAFDYWLRNARKHKKHKEDHTCPDAG